jgi:hypothetical protein
VLTQNLVIFTYILGKEQYHIKPDKAKCIVFVRLFDTKIDDGVFEHKPESDCGKDKQLVPKDGLKAVQGRS